MDSGPRPQPLSVVVTQDDELKIICLTTEEARTILQQLVNNPDAPASSDQTPSENLNPVPSESEAGNDI